MSDQEETFELNDAEAHAQTKAIFAKVIADLQAGKGKWPKFCTCASLGKLPSWSEYEAAQSAGRGPAKMADDRG